MTDEELESLFNCSNERFNELEAKAGLGIPLTRRDLLELRECNNRLHTVAYEIWVRRGQPGDAAFDCLRQPPPKRPLPQSMRPLDLTNTEREEVNH